MNRSDLNRAVASKAGLPVTVVEQVTTEAIDIIGEALAAGDSVSLRRFGKFVPRQRRAMVKANPRTGVPVSVPEKVTIGFVASDTLKDRLNQAS